MKPSTPLLSRKAGPLATALVAVTLLCGVAGPMANAASPRNAAWTLSNDASELRFVTVKNTNIAEVQQFTQLSGEVGPDGAIRLQIDLASVETHIPVRNARMQAMLFETARFPTAQYEGRVDMARVGKLRPGDSVDLEVAGKLSLHGQTQETDASLRVVRLTGDRLLVGTRAPILVAATQFDLVSGIERLRAAAGLPNIGGTVPVSFDLMFHR
jgi:polyisoprenoid-binding protein YceI